MSYSPKPRFAVDLDEIERQLNHARLAPEQRGARTSVSAHETAADFAPMQGQDDDYGPVLAGSAHASPNRHNGTADRVQFPPAAAAEHWDAPEDEPYHPEYDDRHYEADGLSEGEDDLVPLRPRRSSKGVVAAAALLSLAAVGVGGALFFGGSAGMVTTGEPPLIVAGEGPLKVEPQSPGGVEIPNQNKQIYERAGTESNTRVVNREEQPVDVRQATRVASTGIEPMTAPASQSLAASLGEPRRVRTVAIRPDGTIASDAAPAPTPVLPPAAQATSPAPTASVAPTPTPPAPAPAAAPTATPAPALAPAPPAATPAASATPAAATPAASTPRAAASTPSTPPAPPAQPETTPPRPTRMAAAPMSISPTGTPPAASPAPTPAPALPPGQAEVPSGGWAIQLGVRGSESEARSALQQLQQKHADLGNLSPIIRKAEVNGNTLYRMRVGPLSREEAASLCSKLQGAGSECFTARN